MKVFANSFDPASLAILKRIDDLESNLEGLIQAKLAQSLPIALPTSLDSTSPAAPQIDLGSGLVDLWTPGKRPLVSIEAVLQWMPFGALGFPSRLYPTPRAEGDKTPSDPSTWRMSVDVDLPLAEAVLRSFFDNVHIFNPILEEEEVRNYIKVVRFDGIGWDAVSCLVVTDSPPSTTVQLGSPD